MNISEHDKNVFKELGLLVGIVFVLSLVIFGPTKDDYKESVKIPSMEDFDEYPIVAWQAYDTDGGACVRVRYEIRRNKTKLYMFDSTGALVHEQPLALSPFKDGRRRIETYVWKLYRTEWSSDIAPGIYFISVGTEFDRRGIGTEIELL